MLNTCNHDIYNEYFQLSHSGLALTYTYIYIYELLVYFHQFYTVPYQTGVWIHMPIKQELQKGNEK